jgi:hypothetical protein
MHWKRQTHNLKLMYSVYWYDDLCKVAASGVSANRKRKRKERSWRYWDVAGEQLDGGPGCNERVCRVPSRLRLFSSRFPSFLTFYQSSLSYSILFPLFNPLPYTFCFTMYILDICNRSVMNQALNFELLVALITKKMVIRKFRAE